MAIYVSWMEVVGLVRLPQTLLPLLLFLPGEFDDIYVKMRIIPEFYRWGPPKLVLFTSLWYTVQSWDLGHVPKTACAPLLPLPCCTMHSTSTSSLCVVPCQATGANGCPWMAGVASLACA